MAPKLNLGIGARVSCQIKYLHPSEIIRTHFINPRHGQVLEGCIVIGQGTRKIHGKVQPSLIVQHEMFPDITLYAVKRWFKIKNEGPEEGFFCQSTSTPVGDENNPSELPDFVRLLASSNNPPQSVSELEAYVQVDDDKMPAPENIPLPSDKGQGNVFDEWGHDGLCYRLKTNPSEILAKLQNVLLTGGNVPSLLAMFECLFPVDHVQNVMIPEMNKHLDNKLVYGEFLRYLGLWFLMATTYFESRKDFFSQIPPTAFTGAPFLLGHLMSGYRFEQITEALQFTNIVPPAYRDKFWEVRQMLEAWNKRMEKKFCPSTVTCLDKSMSKWVSKYSCPGYMCAPRKP
jgi:hypothetical protein